MVPQCTHHSQLTRMRTALAAHFKANEEGLSRFCQRHGISDPGAPGAYGPPIMMVQRIIAAIDARLAPVPGHSDAPDVFM